MVEQVDGILNVVEFVVTLELGISVRLFAVILLLKFILSVVRLYQILYLKPVVSGAPSISCVTVGHLIVAILLAFVTVMFDGCFGLIISLGVILWKVELEYDPLLKRFSLPATSIATTVYQ